MKIKKHRKDKKLASNSSNYYTKFKKVHLAASGHIVLCRATTVDGVSKCFSWNKKSDRDLVKANTLPDVEIIIENNVPKDKGWDYNG